MSTQNTSAREARTPLPVTPETIAAAKAFALRKWQERARESGKAELPADLTAACKFTSAFAVRVFGGTVEGHLFHHWVRLPGGDILDLNEDAEDVALLKAGIVPDYARDFAAQSGQKPPEDVYANNPKHMRRRDLKESIASVQPRAQRWADEFLDLMAAANPSNRSRATPARALRSRRIQR